MTNASQQALPVFTGWPRQSGRVVGTLIPDVFPDFLLADLSGSETKLLLYVLRHTSGYGKDSDEISLTQFVRGITKHDGAVVDRGTGLSLPTVVAGLRRLVEMGVLVCAHRRDPERGDLPNLYRLRWEDEPADDEAPQISEDPPLRIFETPPSKGFTPPPKGIEDPRLKEFDTQEATRQEATGQEATRQEASSLRSEAPLASLGDARDARTHAREGCVQHYRNPDVEEVFVVWQATIGAPRDRTEVRRDKIVAALKRAPKEDVLDAVRGWRWDDWPSRCNNNDLVDCLRPRNLEKFRDWERGINRPLHQPPRLTAASAMRYETLRQIIAEEEGDRR